MDTRTRTLLATPLLLALLVAVGACSGGSGNESDAGAAREFAPAEAADDALSATDSGGANASDAAYAPEETEQRAVISTGDVQLVADDVAEAREEVERVVARHLGEISDERTESDDDGEMERTKLVVRVPSGDFAETMAELSEIADLRSATSKAEDVTTQVIDNRVRIRAQEKSLRRVEQLLARATSIRDIVSIEAQLTRRQADLDSLKGQQAYLADRTSLGTITVEVDRAAEEEKVAKAEASGGGFGAGLAGGWGALKAFATALATVAGALLPWLVVLVPAGLLVLVLSRRLSGRRTARTPSAG